MPTDKNNPDASSPAGHDEAVARRLRDGLAKLERLRPSGSGDCLDPERIAAYQQRTLAADEMEPCEAHLAACSRCREILTALAATEDEVLVPSEVLEPTAVVGRHIPKERAAAKPARPRRYRWRSLWLVPALTATASALALWFALRPPWLPFARRAAVFVAQTPTAPQAAPEPPVPSAPFSDAAGGLNAGSAGAPAPAASPESLEAQNHATGNRLNMPASAPPVPQQPQAAPSVSAVRPEALAAPAAQPPPPADASTAERAAQTQSNIDDLSAGPAQTNAPANATGNAPQPARPAAAAAASQPSPAPPQSGPLRGMNRAAVPSPQASAAGGVAGAARATNPSAFAPALAPGAFVLALRSPSGTVFWRAGEGGRIEHSSDGGRTWQTQQSPLREDWLAGSAVSDTICWLVGRNGAIARTENGEHWQQILGPTPAPDAGSKAPDWIGISATGAQTATVRSGQASYVTRDGGRTWQPQP